MFSLATGIYQSYFEPPKLSILIIGIDGAGKTSLLERVKVTNINTRLVVNDTSSGTSSDAPSTYVLPYTTRGCAVAGVNNNDSSNVGRDDDDIIQPQRVGTRQQQQQQGLGKPARLPPPLPPKQAMTSSKVVEQMLDGGFSSFSTTSSLSSKEDNSDIGGTSATLVAQHLVMNNVPPPPLANVVESSSSAEGQFNQSKSNKPSAVANNSKPPLPPSHDSSRTDKPPLVKKQTVKKSSFIELFRCPSPKKYSDAALGDDDDEYDDSTTTANTNPTSSAEASEAPQSNKGEGPWSTEYLQNYYINYDEDEEFDVMKAPRGSGGGGSTKKMFPIDRIRPTLGQNLAKLDLCGCKCSLFDLSGAEKMRPLWERYYKDTDAIIYVVNAAETSITNLHQSRRDFERMCNSDILQQRVRCGLPILIFANQLDVAYKEYKISMEKVNGERDGNNRCISWNADEEDDFVGGSPNINDAKDDNDTKEKGVSKRVVEFQDLATLFGFPQHAISLSINRQPSIQVAHQGNVFLFGGSAKTGEGVRAAIEYLVAHAKSYHLGRQARK